MAHIVLVTDDGAVHDITEKTLHVLSNLPGDWDEWVYDDDAIQTVLDVGATLALDGWDERAAKNLRAVAETRERSRQIREEQARLATIRELKQAERKREIEANQAQVTSYLEKMTLQLGERHAAKVEPDGGVE